MALPSTTTTVGHNHKGGSFLKTPVVWLFAVAVCCAVTLRNGPKSPPLLASTTVVPAAAVANNQEKTNSPTPKNSRRHLQDTTSEVLVASKFGPPSARKELWQSDYNLVHVVNTRFMQNQANLLHLGKARLDLFQTFTVPSMLQQTNQQFLWLIWVDNDKFSKDSSLFQDFLQHVSQFPNAVVLGTGDTVPSYGGHSNLRNLYESSWTLLSDAVLAGNKVLLADYYKASKSHVLLETRLDADDALSKTFVESAQSLAAASLGQEDHRMIEYFCPEQHAEWRYFTPDGDSNVNTGAGQLVHYHDKEFCINSGLTTVFHLQFHDMRKLQVAACNLGEGGNGCPPVNTRQLQGGTPYNPRPNVGYTSNNMCTPTNIPDRSEHAAFVEAFDLHTNNENVCPEGSMLCVAAENGPRSETILPEWLNSNAECADNQAIYVQCVPVGCTQDTVILRVCVEERKSGNEITRIRISSEGSPEYKLTEVYMKASTGGMTHDWIDREVTPNVVGGVFSDIFGTPFNPRNYVPYGLSHVDVCVAPHTTGSSCRRRMSALRDEADDANKNTIQSVLPSVLMARTPTAAGMKHVVPNNNKKTQTKKKNVGTIAANRTTTTDKSLRMDTFDSNQAQAWDLMHREFGVNKTQVAQLRERFEENMEAILIDAFAGQCTPGHSCKESTKRALGRLLNQVQHKKHAAVSAGN